jgi:hypothetical protein
MQTQLKELILCALVSKSKESPIETETRFLAPERTTDEQLALKNGHKRLRSNGDLGSFGATWTMGTIGRLEGSTGSATSSNESSTKPEAL